MAEQLPSGKWLGRKSVSAATVLRYFTTQEEAEDFEEDK